MSGLTPRGRGGHGSARGRGLTPRGAVGREGHDRGAARPALEVFTTTLWEYPSQHYGPISAMQGSAKYVGATPSWVIWQLLMRYTKPGDLVIDPMCGSGTTLDVARDLGRRALGYDLAPTRADIFRADARKIPLEDGKADFVFVDPPYSTHVDYSDDPRCIGKLDSGGADGGAGYYAAMDQVIGQMHRVLRPGGYAGLYVSDSFVKGRALKAGEKPAAGASPAGRFMAIGFELFARLRKHFVPVDIIAVVRRNQKLERGNWKAAAEEGNFFLRGFNYLMVMYKG